MPNVTVSVPEDVYRHARIEAARQGRSVSALVAEFLTGLGEGGDEFERLLAQQDEVLAEIGAFRAADRLDRGRLYDRAVR